MALLWKDDIFLLYAPLLVAATIASLLASSSPETPESQALESSIRKLRRTAPPPQPIQHWPSSIHY
jgi:hypothetical protein